MEEFLGSAPPSAILIMMAFPLTGAALLVGFLVFFSSRRVKQGKMKHGSQTNTFNFSQSGNSTAANNLQVNQSHKRPSAFTTENSTGSMGSDLNLDILSSGLEREMAVGEASSPATEPVDIARRLGNQPAPAQTAEPEELLRLLRDPQSGQLILQIGGQRYKKLADVVDKKVGQYILKLAAHLLAFTNGMIVTDAGVKSVYQPKVGPTPESLAKAQPSTAPLANTKADSPRDEPLLAQPSAQAQAAFLDSSRMQPAPQPELPSSRGLFGRSAPTAPPSMLPVLNLAKEINDIVQNRLMYSPLGANTRIEIISAPDGGIRINVNGSFYGSPDEVPDPEVKALIKESIKQWERS